MENRLMDKYEVASFIGGISPRTAGELMRSMPCVNIGNGQQRLRLRVSQLDLEQWLENRKAVRLVRSPVSDHAKTDRKKALRGDGLDENGYVLKRKKGR